MLLKTKLLPLALALAFSGAAFADDEIKIGHVAPLTGPDSHLGKDNENAAKLAVEELNAKGVKIGGKKVKFVLMLEDDGSDPKQGTAVAQKLVDAHVNGVVGHLNSSTTVPASKIYHDNGVPEISPSSTTPQYTKQGFKSAFRVVANDGKIGSTLGRYAVQNLGAKKVAIIDDRTAYGQGVADEFAKGVKAAGNVEVLQRQYTTNKATDFMAILTQIKSKNPDLVFFGGMDAVGGPLLKQLKALGIKARVMGGDGICTESLPKLAGDGLGEGNVYCAEAGGVTGDGEKAMADFNARYKKRFGQDQLLYAPYVYDAVMVMATAMQKANSAEPAKYLPALHATNYQGVTGKITFDEFGDIKDGAMTLFTYKGGKKTKLEVVR